MSNTMAAAAAAPPAPIPPSNLAPEPTDFLLSQIRSTLRYLVQLGRFDATTYRQIHHLLASGLLAPPPPPTPSRTDRADADADGDAEPSLGAKNRWLRKALCETPILPSAVDTLLSLTTGPLLSDEQREAIVALVEASQEDVAHKLTDPAAQRRVGSATRLGIEGAGRGAGRGWRNVERSWSGMVQQRARKKDEERERRKAEREIRKELKSERAEVVRRRQREMLEGGAGAGPSRAAAQAKGDEDAVSRLDDVASVVTRGAGRSPVVSPGVGDGDGDGESADSDDTEPAPFPSAPQLTFLPASSTSSTHVDGATTCLVVRPGLALAYSVVVLEGPRAHLLPLAQPSDHVSASSDSRTADPPKRPPPPPLHPSTASLRSLKAEAEGTPSSTADRNGTLPPAPVTPTPPMPPRKYRQASGS